MSAPSEKGAPLPVSATYTPTQSYRLGYTRFLKQPDFGSGAGNCFQFEDSIASVLAEVLDLGNGKKGLVARPVFIVDPCQAQTAGPANPLKTWSLIANPGSGSIVLTGGDSATAGIVGTSRIQRIDTPTVVNTVNGPLLDFLNYGYHGVSGTNSPQTAAFDAKGLKSMALQMTTSAGTSTVIVHGSMDNFVTQDLTIDSIATAGTTTKQYDDTHLATTIAVNPMLFRFIKVIVGTAGVGNTSTLDIACK